MADGAPKPEAQPGTEVTAFVQGLLQQMQARFDKLSDNIIVKIDDMGSRIDELERGITEIIEQASAEEHGDSAAKS